eukprot:6341999-Pyramimonas_sp.AAC.1
MRTEKRVYDITIDSSITTPPGDRDRSLCVSYVGCHQRISAVIELIPSSVIIALTPGSPTTATCPVYASDVQHFVSHMTARRPAQRAGHPLPIPPVI